MGLIVMTPLPPREEPTSPPVVLLYCEGACPRNSYSGRFKFTRHIFIRADLVPRGQAQIYACTKCGTERRFGLIGTTIDADVD